MRENSEDYPQITQITLIKKQGQDSKGRTEDFPYIIFHFSFSITFVNGLWV